MGGPNKRVTREQAYHIPSGVVEYVAGLEIVQPGVTEKRPEGGEEAVEGRDRTPLESLKWWKQWKGSGS